MTVPAPRSVDHVQADMLAELPDGWASTHSPDSFLGARLRPAADAFASIEASALSMLPEIDPRSAPHLLSDWERVLGPDPCQVAAGVTDAVTLGKLAYAKLTNDGTICAGFFERFALTIGETITITEYPAQPLGRFKLGVSMLISPPRHCEFKVTLPTTHVTKWICGATPCGESIGKFNHSVMECVIRNGAPLFATPYFSYTG